MNEKQQQRFDQLLEEYQKQKQITPGVRGLIRTLACVEIEEEEMQEYVNEHGSTYVSFSGLHKTRPEWSQLREARMRKHTLVTVIDRRAGNEPEEEMTELEKLYFS
jgi:hypothetical protein